MRCESFYVHLVNDRMGRWPVNRRVAFPVIQAGIYYHALHRIGSVVSFLLRCFTRVAFRDNHAATIWVEQNFRSIKSQPAGRIVRSISPKAVKLTGLHARLSAVCRWFEPKPPSRQYPDEMTACEKQYVPGNRPHSTNNSVRPGTDLLRRFASSRNKFQSGRSARMSTPRRPSYSP